MECKTANNISLVKTKSGKFSIRITDEEGLVKSLHSLYDPEEEARKIVDSFQYDGRGILVVLGLGLGYHLKELKQKYPHAKIVVIESEMEIYNHAIEHGKLSSTEEGVDFIIGISPADALGKITKIQIVSGIPSLAVFPLNSAVSSFPDYYKPILARLKKAVSLKLWERLRYPKFTEGRLRIAMIDFGYFLTKEVKKALNELGHSVINIPIQKEKEGEMVLQRLIEAVIEFKPDFILTINHLGFDEDGVLTSFFKSIEMPVASWYVDSPSLIVKAFDKNVSPYVSMFLWDRGYIEKIKDAGFESVTYLPLATDEKVFKPMQLKQRVKNKYRADVGFVGNSMVASTKEKFEKVPEKFHPFIEKTALQLSFTRIKYDEVLKTVYESGLKDYGALTDRQSLDLEAAVLWKATLLYRRSCIENLKNFNLHIYGDGGWKSLLDDSYRIKPPLNYYKDLPDFYNACKINFNATHLQMGQAVNQRVFDVPSCGAFLLTDYQESLEEIFEIGKELIAYKDKGEISELADFYLNNPEKRSAIANSGRKRILKEHTYTHRLRGLIEFMKRSYR